MRCVATTSNIFKCQLRAKKFGGRYARPSQVQNIKSLEIVALIKTLNPLKFRRIFSE
jgi:hypothetical protein